MNDDTMYGKEEELEDGLELSLDEEDDLDDIDDEEEEDDADDDEEEDGD